MAHATVHHVINTIEYPKEISPAARWLFVQIADRADKDHWTCYPSHKTLAKDAGMSPRSVLSLLDALETHGFITRVKQFRSDGTRSTDLITVTRYAGIAAPPDQSQPAAKQGAEVAAHNHGTQPGKVRDKTGAKANFCPEGWEPTPSHSAKAIELGLTAEQMQTEADKFREWEFREARTDWDRAFHRWLRTAAERMKEVGHVRGSPASPASFDRSAERAAGRVQAMVEGARIASSSGRRRWAL